MPHLSPENICCHIRFPKLYIVFFISLGPHHLFCHLPLADHCSTCHDPHYIGYLSLCYFWDLIASCSHSQCLTKEGPQERLMWPLLPHFRKFILLEGSLIGFIIWQKLIIHFSDMILLQVDLVSVCTCGRNKKLAKKNYCEPLLTFSFYGADLVPHSPLKS